MVNEILVMGLTAYATEMVKGYFGKKYVPLFVLGFATLFYAGIGFLTNSTIASLLPAVKEGFMLGAAASGIYGMGQAVKDAGKIE